MITSCKIFSAPLQGFTTHIWRSAHVSIFGGIDAYYSPFMRVEHGNLLNRDIVDANPLNNQGIHFIPQILACNPDDALLMVNHLKSVGYNHININFGCPFPPIALKHKGSGMLPFPQEVESLFSALKSVTGISYSIKMRLGWQDANDWRNIFPLMDLLSPTHIIVHPCIGKDQYKGNLNHDAFTEMVKVSHYPLIYNGNIQSLRDIEEITRQHPSVQGVMIGRALASDPALLYPEKATPDNYRKLHNLIYSHYAATLDGGEHQVLKKMQSFWEMYLLHADRKCRKAIKKATSIAKYEAALDTLFSTLSH